MCSVMQNNRQTSTASAGGAEQAFDTCVCKRSPKADTVAGKKLLEI